MRTIGNDRGAVRLANFTWLFVVLAIVGVFAYDGVAVLTSRVRVENDAQTAAFAASSAWHSTLNIDSAYEAAVASVAGHHETVETKHFTIDSNGEVHLLLTQQVHSIVLKHIGPLRKYTLTVESGDANSIN
jgi:hypothetical protein